MKRFVSVLICFLIVLPLCGCDSQLKKTDEAALPFVKAMLNRDVEGMKTYLHPDYIETALPDDAFYKELTDKHFFAIGNELTSLTAVGKNYVTETDIEGDLIQCQYVIMTNELYYNVELMMLENETGFGIIAVSAELNTTPDLYKQSNKGE